MPQNQKVKAWLYGAGAFAALMLFWWWQGGSLLPRLANRNEPTPQERTMDAAAAMFKEGWQNAAAVVRFIAPGE